MVSDCKIHARKDRVRLYTMTGVNFGIEMAKACLAKADEWGEPPLEEQD